MSKKCRRVTKVSKNMHDTRIERPNFQLSDLNDAISGIKAMIAFRLRQKGEGIFLSRHEMSGIIDEEVIEFKEAVRSGTRQKCEEELIDIAVAAILSLASYKSGKVQW